MEPITVHHKINSQMLGVCPLRPMQMSINKWNARPNPQLKPPWTHSFYTQILDAWLTLSPSYIDSITAILSYAHKEVPEQLQQAL